jgi:hypothetical protein
MIKTSKTRKIIAIILLSFSAYLFMSFLSVNWMTDEWCIMRASSQSPSTPYIKVGGWHPLGRYITLYTYDPDDPANQYIIGGWCGGFIDWFGNIHITIRS